MNNFKPKGFTLIELLISFALITFLIMGTAELVVHSLIIKKRADYNIKTSELVFSKIEYLKSFDFDSEILKESSHSKTYKEQVSKEKYSLSWEIKDISERMKQIEMECYPENCPRKKSRMMIYLSRELGF